MGQYAVFNRYLNKPEGIQIRSGRFTLSKISTNNLITSTCVHSFMQQRRIVPLVPGPTTLNKTLSPLGIDTRSNLRSYCTAFHWWRIKTWLESQKKKKNYEDFSQVHSKSIELWLELRATVAHSTWMSYNPSWWIPGRPWRRRLKRGLGLHPAGVSLIRSCRQRTNPSHAPSLAGT